MKEEKKETNASCESVAFLGKVLFDAVQDTEFQDLELFEQYTTVLKKKIYHEESGFLNKIESGYKVLLETVRKSES